MFATTLLAIAYFSLPKRNSLLHFRWMLFVKKQRRLGVGFQVVSLYLNAPPFHVDVRNVAPNAGTSKNIWFQLADM